MADDNPAYYDTSSGSSDAGDGEASVGEGRGLVETVLHIVTRPELNSRDYKVKGGDPQHGEYKDRAATHHTQRQTATSGVRRAFSRVWGMRVRLVTSLTKDVVAELSSACF